MHMESIQRYWICSFLVNVIASWNVFGEASQAIPRTLKSLIVAVVVHIGFLPPQQWLRHAYFAIRPLASINRILSLSDTSSIRAGRGRSCGPAQLLWCFTQFRILTETKSKLSSHRLCCPGQVRLTDRALEGVIKLGCPGLVKNSKCLDSSIDMASRVMIPLVPKIYIKVGRKSDCAIVRTTNLAEFTSKACSTFYPFV